MTYRFRSTQTVNLIGMIKMTAKNIGEIIEEMGGVKGVVEYMKSGKMDFHVLEPGKGIYTKLRKIYDLHLPDIIEAYSSGCGYDPYFVDWPRLFTPIEGGCWNLIRYYGVNLLPQFPTMGFILDFANPHLKIAVECDGKDWHDEEKDRKRDEKLNSEGWKVYRIKGSEFYKKYKLPCELSEDGICRGSEDYEREFENWIMNTGDGVMCSLKQVYFIKGMADDLYYRSLSKHMLIQFGIDIRGINNPYY